MIDQVLADRQIGDGRDAELLQLGRGADPGEEQDAGRIERSGAKDHLSRGNRLQRAIVALDGDAPRAVALHHEA